MGSVSVVQVVGTIPQTIIINGYVSEQHTKIEARKMAEYLHKNSSFVYLGELKKELARLDLLEHSK